MRLRWGPSETGLQREDEAERQTSALTAEIGDRVKVRVTVTNAGRLPVPWVLLDDLLPGDALKAQFPRSR